MTLRTSSCPHSKPLWRRNYAPFADSAKAQRRPPRPAPRKVGLKSAWHMTYSERRAPHCMSPNCSAVSRPASGSRSIARVSSPRSPRKWPGAIASCAPTKTPSAYAPRPDEHPHAVVRLLGDHRSVASPLPPTAQLETRRATFSGLAGLPGPTLPVAYYLDQRRPAARLGARVFVLLALPVGSPTTVCPHPPPSARLLSGPVCGHGRR